MKQNVTTYTVKSKNYPDIWVFKYHLNGVLASFEVLEGTLNERQVRWLFDYRHFPYQEHMISAWEKMITNFEIHKDLPDLTFEAFWEAYDQKVKKVMAEKAWEKMTPADRIKAFIGIKGYNNYLQRKNGIQKAHASTYLNQRYFEDEWHKAK